MANCTTCSSLNRCLKHSRVFVAVSAKTRHASNATRVSALARQVGLRFDECGEWQ